MRFSRWIYCGVLAAGCLTTSLRADVSYDFNADGGGFTVGNYGAIEDPWTYNSGPGTWSVDGSTGVGAPTASGLRTQTFQLDAAGTVDLTFDHRYSIEWDGTTRWDGAALRYRVNNGDFQHVDGSQFSTEGYIATIQGNNALNGLQGFSDVSDGYFDDEFITSVAQLGSYNAGDLIQVEFLGAWDEFARGNPDGTVPNWEIDSLTVVGPVSVGPALPPPPLFVGGDGTIGQDALDAVRSNEVYGAPVSGVPGFTGRIVTFEEHGMTLNDHSTAELALEDFDGEFATGSYDVVDFGGGGGTFGSTNPYPNGVADTSMSDFAVQVFADVTIPAGEWTIGFGSDDGGQVTIAGIELIEFTNDNFEDDQIRFEGNRGHGWTVGTFELDEPLTTTLIGSMHERGGGDSFEIAVLDEAFLDTGVSEANGWQLLGDGVFGWSVTTTTEPLVSADLDGSAVTDKSYRFDINGDTGEADQIAISESNDDVYNSTLNIEGATFQINATGTIAAGQAFQIVSADTIVGTPTVLSLDPSQTWVFDSATGNVCLGSCGDSLLGDFNADGAVTTADLDVMTVGDVAFDVTGDGMTDAADVNEMVANLIGTWIGDSNGDGEFGTSDFVQVFTVGKFESGQAAVWSEGDWNLDGVFDTSDFVAAFTEGGFERGPRGGVSAVPEPCAGVLLLCGLLGLMRFRRK